MFGWQNGISYINTDAITLRKKQTKHILFKSRSKNIPIKSYISARYKYMAQD